MQGKGKKLPRIKSLTEITDCGFFPADRTAAHSEKCCGGKLYSCAGFLNHTLILGCLMAESKRSAKQL